MMEYDAVLKIAKTKMGFEHKAEFTNHNGKLVSFFVLEHARYYSCAAEGTYACRVELSGSSTIARCVVPGQEAQPLASSEQKKTAGPAANGRHSGSNNASFGRRASSGGNSPVEGRAPYNFVPCKPGVIAPPKKGERRKWSGTLVCGLKALTPLLVSGQQSRQGDTAADCSFLRINGQPVIPGTAVKGMLRAVMEALSFSGLRPVSRKKLFWRNVAGQEYRGRFPLAPQGGFLRKRGADYYILPVDVRAVPRGTPPGPGVKRVQTGGIIVKGVPSKDYFFSPPDKSTEEIPVDREVVLRLWAQLTPNQEERWPQKSRDKRLVSDPGLPVFYSADSEGQPIDLGFCRYFRLEYKYSPWDLAWPGGDEEAEDFARAIFGHVGKSSQAGRLAIEPFEVRGAEYKPGSGVDVVLGSPKPTCLPFYLVQDRAKIRVISSGKKNDKDCMANYNDRDARLRGRKLYWHHDPDENHFPPGKNEKTVTRLHPLAAGASGEFVIHVNRLTDTELGCLLEALELREGCAHKLGMGRSLGFGSVQLELKAVHIVDCGQKYRSLAGRLDRAQAAPMSRERMESLREQFRAHVFDSVKSHWRDARDFYSLPPIDDLFRMLDYAHRPAPDKVSTMKLKEFADNPLLPPPGKV